MAKVPANWELAQLFSQITQKVRSILDLVSDIKKTIEKNIKIGFYPNIPKDERKYLLKNANVGIDDRGAYIHFFLAEDDKTIEFIITGIKNYRYDINAEYRKYWVSSSDDLLNSSGEEQGEGNYNTFRFFLFINEND